MDDKLLLSSSKEGKENGSTLEIKTADTVGITKVKEEKLIIATELPRPIKEEEEEQDVPIKKEPVTTNENDIGITSSSESNDSSDTQRNSDIQDEEQCSTPLEPIKKVEQSLPAEFIPTLCEFSIDPLPDSFFDALNDLPVISDSRESNKNQKRLQHSKKKKKSQNRTPERSDSTLKRRHSYSDEDDNMHCRSVGKRSSASCSEATNSVATFKRIKLKKPLDTSTTAITVQPNMTVEEKRQKAMAAASQILELLHPNSRAPKTSKRNTKNIPTECPLLYTPTVRKLPSHNSCFMQQIYDNRSPLHAINNVEYKFNSTATRININQWGLEALTPRVAKVARLVGIDTQTLNKQLSSSKLSGNLGKTKNTAEKCDNMKQTCFANAMTQTSQKDNGHDIAVQVCAPNSSTIGCQTSISGNSGQQTEQKIYSQRLNSLMQTFNQNQILSLTDFAEELGKPSVESADEIYQLRSKLLNILKSGQTSCPSRQSQQMPIILTPSQTTMVPQPMQQMPVILAASQPAIVSAQQMPVILNASQPTIVPQHIGRDPRSAQHTPNINQHTFMNVGNLTTQQPQYSWQPQELQQLQQQNQHLQQQLQQQQHQQQQRQQFQLQQQRQQPYTQSQIAAGNPPVMPSHSGHSASTTLPSHAAPHYNQTTAQGQRTPTRPQRTSTHVQQCPPRGRAPNDSRSSRKSLYPTAPQAYEAYSGLPD